MIRAPKEDERRTSRIGINLRHSPDHDNMIAAVVLRVGPALEHSERRDQNGAARASKTKFDPLPFVYQGRCKARRKMFLIVPEEIDRKSFGLKDGIQTQYADGSRKLQRDSERG